MFLSRRFSSVRSATPPSGRQLRPGVPSPRARWPDGPCPLPVVQARRDPLATADLGDAVLAAQALPHDRIFSSAECCFRVRRRMSFTTASASAFNGPAFCPIFTPCGYDEPEILRSSINPICSMGADAGQVAPSSTSSGLGSSARHDQRPAAPKMSQSQTCAPIYRRCLRRQTDRCGQS